MRFRQKRILLGIPQSQIATAISQSTGQLYTPNFISKLECGKLKNQTVLPLTAFLKNSLNTKKQYGRKYVHLATSRKKRTTFPTEARIALITAFEQNPRPGFQEINQLSTNLHIDVQTVKVWFQNRLQASKRNISHTKK